MSPLPLAIVWACHFFYCFRGMFLSVKRIASSHSTDAQLFPCFGMNSIPANFILSGLPSIFHSLALSNILCLSHTHTPIAPSHSHFLPRFFRHPLSPHGTWLTKMNPSKFFFRFVREMFPKIVADLALIPLGYFSASLLAMCSSKKWISVSRKRVAEFLLMLIGKGFALLCFTVIPTHFWGENSTPISIGNSLAMFFGNLLAFSWHTTSKYNRPRYGLVAEASRCRRLMNSIIPYYGLPQQANFTI